MLTKYFLPSLIFSLVLTPILGRVARGLKLVDDRRKVPYLGGLAIFISFLPFVINIREFRGQLFACAIILSLGLIDDRKDLTAGMKFLGEVVGFSILIICGAYTKIVLIPFFFNFLITAIWVLGITNAFNLLDILDGLAGGIAAIIAFSFVIFGLYTNNLQTAGVSAALLGATLGFLVYNLPPAKIYMGDCGSLFLGFLLATLSMNISYASLENKHALLVPILIMGFPIFDLSYVVIKRLQSGKALFSKSEDHFALSLLKKGYSVRRVLATSYSIALIICAAAFALFLIR